MSEQVTQVIDPAGLEAYAAVHAYVARVRTALADLPPGEIEEIVEDITPHLREIADELGETTVAQLVDRLGTPEAYAAELRAAAGYPEVGGGGIGVVENRTRPRRALWTLAAASAVAVIWGAVSAHVVDKYERMEVIAVGIMVISVLSSVAALPYLRRTSADVPEVAALPETTWLLRVIQRNAAGTRKSQILSYVRSLQPAWWLARAMLVAVLFAGIPYRAVSNLVLWALVTVPLAVASIWLGRRVAGDRRLLWVVFPLNAVILGLGVAGAEVHINRDWGYSVETGYAGRPGLWSDGKLVSNVYVFDANGKPLTDVYLYDQDGKPLEASGVGCTYNDGTSWMPESPDNRVPKPMDLRPDGTCVALLGVPFTVTIPQRAVTPTPSATPPASPSHSGQANPSPSPTG